MGGCSTDDSRTLPQATSSKGELMGAGRTTLSTVLTLFALLTVVCGLRPAPAAGQSDQAGAAVGDLEWPLPAQDQKYGTIDGDRMWQYVAEQAAIARQYRDNGHPQFWGRIIASSADSVDADWLLSKFNQAGLSDTYIQRFDMQPQWFPQSWQVTISAGGNATTLTSAQPVYLSPGTDESGLNLEAVWVGAGTPADFLGRDVRGKAVFVASADPPGWAPQNAQAQSGYVPGALKLAEQKGAAALFWIYTELPGNAKYEAYPTDTDVPTFALGREDGLAVEKMIAEAGSAPPHVKVRMDVEMVPNLRSAMVWGTLPGRTDETIYVIAHRDGWFESATDNASGVATMIGLAEYFAKLPRSQRRRTLVFVGISGHHNSGPGCCVGTTWMNEHKDSLFSKTALMINSEHTSSRIYHRFQGKIVDTNMYIPAGWYAGGPTRPRLQEIVRNAFDEFGVAAWSEPDSTPPAGDLGRFYEFLPGFVFQTNDFLQFHTDENTPETVSRAGLEAITRADAKIIDGVNELDLSDLQRPEGTP